MHRSPASCGERPAGPGAGSALATVHAVPRPRLLAIPFALVLAVALAACGGSGRKADVTVPTLGAASVPATTTASTTPAATVPPATSTPSATTPARTTTTPAKTVTTPSSPQGTGGAPAGCDTAVGGFIRDVQASGTDCGRAKDVASTWFAAVHGGAAPDSQISAAGYACGATMAGERASVTCTAASDGSKVTFTASP